MDIVRGDVMGMTPKQRYRIRQYLKRIQSQREYKETLKNQSKKISWSKKLGILGFLFFLLKGLFWLSLLYLGVGIL